MIVPFQVMLYQIIANENGSLWIGTTDTDACSIRRIDRPENQINSSLQ